MFYGKGHCETSYPILTPGGVTRKGGPAEQAAALPYNSLEDFPAGTFYTINSCQRDGKRFWKEGFTTEKERIAGMTEDFRRYPRYSISAKAVITRHGEGPAERLNAQVLTISQGGMGFYANRPLDKATPVAVEFLVDAMNGLGILVGKIASVSSQGEDFFVGIAFDREIPYERFASVID